MDIIKTFGHNVRKHRKQLGLSQEKLAELAGLHPSYIGQIERAEASVSVKTVDKIIRALSIRYEDFFAKSHRETKNETASECYDRISAMSAKQQKVILDIIMKILEFDN